MRGAKVLLLALVCLVTSLVAREAGAAHRITPKRLHKGVTALSVDTVKSPATVNAAADYQAAKAELVKAQAAQQQLKAEQQAAQRLRAAGLKAETVQPTHDETAAASAADAAVKATTEKANIAKTALTARVGAAAAANADSANFSADIGGGLFAAVPATGTSWQSSVVSGLANFLAERGNEELALWVATEIASQICDRSKSTPVWSPRDLLPQTCQVADTALQSPSGNPSQLGSLLASAIRNDLEALPFQILTGFLHFDDASREELVAIFTQLREGAALLPLLTGMATDKTLQAACRGTSPNAKPAVKGSVSACILVAIGDVVSAAGGINESPGADTTSAISTLASSVVTQLQTDIQVTLCKGAGCDPAVVTWLDRLVDPTANTAVVKALEQLFTDVSSLHDTVQGWKKIAASDTATVLARAGQLLGGLTTIGDDTIAVLEAPFAHDQGSIACTKDSAPTFCAQVQAVGDGWNKATPVVTAAADAFKGQYADAAREVLVFVQDNWSQGDLPPQLVKYLGFVVDLSQAKSANDVKSLLDNAAAPVGSWRLKRQKTFVWSVTGFLGAAGGFESPTSVPPATSNVSYGGMYGAAGLTASVGLDFSFNLGKGWTLGPYLSALDVGQLVSTPLTPGGTGSAKPAAGGDISLAQVIAPGAFLRLGLGNTPFVVGAGATYAPSLRKYEYSQTTGSDEVSVIRLQAFVAIDLTLFPIATCGDPDPPTKDASSK